MKVADLRGGQHQVVVTIERLPYSANTAATILLLWTTQAGPATTDEPVCAPARQYSGFAKVNMMLSAQAMIQTITVRLCTVTAVHCKFARRYSWHFELCFE